jgi:hypothetical protein
LDVEIRDPMEIRHGLVHIYKETPALLLLNCTKTLLNCSIVIMSIRQQQPIDIHEQFRQEIEENLRIDDRFMNNGKKSRKIGVAP